MSFRYGLRRRRLRGWPARNLPELNMDFYTSVWARVIVESPTVAPNEVTAILGIEPTAFFERGTRRSPASKSRHKLNTWVIESAKLPPDSDPTPLVNDLLVTIGMSMTLLGRARGQVTCRLEVYFGLVAKDYAPVLDPDIVERAAAQGLGVMVHRTYPYAGGTREH